MSPMVNAYEDRLKDYTDVKERVRLFYERHPDGRLVTAKVKVTTEPDGVPRVWVKAKAYRSPDDPHPGVGWSWMPLPGITNFTRRSEIENTETSAWGRAIGALGIGIVKSIASVDEIAGKEGEEEPPGDHGSLIGTADYAKDFADFMWRQSEPDGAVLGFRLITSAGGIKVLAFGALAEVLSTQRDDVIGKRVQCWGRIHDETFTPRNAKRPVTYQVLELDRIKTASGMLPAPATATEPPVPVAEAPSIPMLLDEDERAAVGGGLP